MIPYYDDETIISQIQNDDTTNLESLINNHSGIYLNLVNSITHTSGHLNMELREDCSRIIYEAANDFDPSRGVKFGTYVGNRSKWNALDTLSDFGKVIPIDEEILKFKIDCNTEINKERESAERNLELVKKILEQIREKNVKRAVSLRFFNKKHTIMPFTQVGKIMGVSRTTAKAYCDRFITLAKNKLASDVICDTV
ncbi:MAG: hypothetical protein WC390_06530 [Sulfurimonas sp.]|jgi:DNA-directed RNA polymerase specialized sigma subunit